MIKPKNYITSFILLTLFFSLISCNSKDPTQNCDNRVIIAGTVLNSEKYPNDFSVTIIIDDFSRFPQRIHIAYLDENGNFKFDFAKYFPQDIFLRYGKLFNQLFVHPGDSIYIQFDADEYNNPNPENRYKTESVTFSGNAIKINHDFSTILPQLLNSFPPSIEQTEKIKTLAPFDYKDYILSKRKESKNLLDTYINNHKPCKTFIEWANYYLDYNCGNDLLKYIWYNPFLNNKKGERLVLPEDYYDFTDKFRLDNKAASICSRYLWYLNEYSSHLWSESREERKELTDSKDFLLEHKIFINKLIKNVQGFALDVMMTREFYLLLDYFKKIDVFEEFYPIYKKMIAYECFKNTIDAKYTELKLQEKNPGKSYYYQQRNQPIETLKDGIFSSVLENNKGKVIYIDFLATWCGPCLMEIPFSMKLQKRYQGKDVVFVYFCVKSKKSKWESIISDYNMKGDLYLLSDSQYDVLSEKFQISGIPRYILVNKDGVVIDKNAQRPSFEGKLNTDLINEINSHIED